MTLTKNDDTSCQLFSLLLRFIENTPAVVLSDLSKSPKLLSFRTKIKIVRFCLKLVSQFPIRMPAMYHRPIIFNIQKYLDIAFGVSWLLFVKSKPLKVEL